MDPNQLRSDAYTATNQVADMQTAAPSMLSQLKQNLVGIFSKDNPVMGARDAALSDYLSTPQRARADLLPTNLPMIEGRNLTLSPTQQDAITSSRSAASLVPLLGLNEIIKAGYGNIGEAVQGAGQIYNGQIQGASTRASGLMDMYKQAVAEQQYQQNLELERQKLAASRASSAGIGLDLPSILAAIGGSLGTNGGKNPSLDDIFSSAPAPKKTASAAQPKVNLSSSVKAGGGGNQLAQASGGGGNILDSILSWLKGPTINNNYASTSQLGF